MKRASAPWPSSGARTETRSMIRSVASTSEAGSTRKLSRSAGEEQLREAAEVGDAAGAVEGAQRRERPAAVAILAVEIVLGDPALGALRPVQEFEPPLQAEHGAERKMMSGRHNGEARLGRQRLCRFD